MVRIICCIALCCCALSCTDIIAGNNPEYLNLVQLGSHEYESGRYDAAEKAFSNALRVLERNEYAERAETLAELGNI
jgi:hypothetical protein